MIPLIRYENNSIDFTNNINTPNFPINSGETYHSYTTNKPDLIHTSRLHGTTETSWISKNLKKTFRDEIYTFWDAILQNGYNQCSVVDHVGRILFDAYWYRWVETWKAKRGGVFDINYNFSAPVSWTLPTIGVYPFTQNSLISHNNRSGTTLNFNTGASLITNAFRTNGYILSAAAGSAGIQNTNTLPHQFEDSSFSFFAQISGTSGNFTVISLENTDIGSELAMAINGSSQIYGYLSDGTSTTSTTGISFFDASWFDVGFSYNAQINKCFVYLWRAGESTETYQEYLENNSVLSTAYITKDTALNFSNTREWNKISIGVNGTGSTHYVANPFIFEGVLGAMEFNSLRRLCYNWNQTTGINPK